MPPNREPSFLDPLNSTFVYAGWSVDPVRVGPFVRRSSRRGRKIDELRGVARVLTKNPDVETVRLFETSFMPPLRHMPQHDVVLLARARTRAAAEKVSVDSQLASTMPRAVFLAANGARFGATEDGVSHANILLNHFTGPVNRSTAVDAWRSISAWFVTKLRVDNSTLLRTDDGAPYLLVNYVRLPATIVGFLMNQLTRPSFHRYVRRMLKANQLTSFPLFVRNVPFESAGA
jgi:ABC-type transporter Mla MlaB component